MASSKKQDYLAIRYGKLSLAARGFIAVSGVVVIFVGILVVVYAR